MREVMNVVYLLIIILVPIIPAYLLFKKLKSSAEAAGDISPVKEFSVKFGGAFAGYFSIFLLLYLVPPYKFAQENTSKVLWEITGNVKDEKTDQIIPSTQADLQVKLKPYGEVKAGTFTLYLTSTIVNGTEKLDYSLQVEDNKNVYLSSTEFNLDKFKGQSNGNVIQLPDSLLKLNKNPNADTLKVEPAKEVK